MFEGICRSSWSFQNAHFFIVHLLYAVFTNSDAGRVKNDNLVIYEEGWEASRIIGIIVLISLTVTCFIRVAFDRAF